MNFLVVGLGSMGKRRVRCLYSLGHENIVGFDMRDDRRKEVVEQHGIKTVEKVEDVDFDAIDAIIISTPPDKHLDYVRLAIEKNKPSFVEASVILEGLANVRIDAEEKGLLVAPSCTLRFHPAVKTIKNIVEGGRYGKVTNFSYHSGQYLPDWHPWEKVTDYYVSKKEVNACREIVPFELTWIVDIIGPVKNASAFYGQTMDVGANVNDTYAITMEFKDSYGTMIVDVVSRSAVRSLLLNMELGQIKWDWNDNNLKLYSSKTEIWKEIEVTTGQAAEGYNPNIIEEMYIEELETFISAINKQELWPNTLDDDISILKTLRKLEGISF